MNDINMSNVSKIIMAEASASRSMRNATVQEAIVDVKPLMSMLLLLLDLGIIREIPIAYKIAEWAWEYGRVQRR